MEHVRDYAFSELKGGSKGEAADYLLYDTGSKMQLVPITSRIKLNKTRKTNAVAQNETEQAKDEISHIVMASRVYSIDEAKKLNSAFTEYGDMKYKISKSAVPFSSKDIVQVADR